jgi:hypothetical protein
VLDGIASAQGAGFTAIKTTVGQTGCERLRNRAMAEHFRGVGIVLVRRLHVQAKTIAASLQVVSTANTGTNYQPRLGAGLCLKRNILISFDYYDVCCKNTTQKVKKDVF